MHNAFVANRDNLYLITILSDVTEFSEVFTVRDGGGLL